MTIINYEIKIGSSLEDLFIFLNGQTTNQTKAPILIQGDKITVSYDHTIDQSLAFKRQILKNLFVIDDGTEREEITANSEATASDDCIIQHREVITGTNLSTTYVTPGDYQQLGIDLNGFKAMGIQILWDKNGGAATHSARLIKHGDTNSVLYENTNLTTGYNGVFNIAIPQAFKTYQGLITLQVKSSAINNNPIIRELRLYRRRKLQGS